MPSLLLMLNLLAEAAKMIAQHPVEFITYKSIQATLRTAQVSHTLPNPLEPRPSGWKRRVC